MSTNYDWLFYVPMLLTVLFCLAALSFIAARSRQYSRPKRYASAAITILLVSQFAMPLANAFLFRWVNVQIASGVISIVMTLMVLFALGLLIAAVFIDRPAPQPPGWDPGGTPLADNPSDNPYASPRQ